MKEHPLLFNADMVRALLAGRKTQTRRVIDAPNLLVDGNGISKKRWLEAGFDLANAWIDNGPSPAGNAGPYLKATCAEDTTHRLYPRMQPGHRIWVKETFEEGLCTKSTLAYRATHKPSDLDEGWDEPIKWKPSIFMPRWASRITLEIVSVRPERLKDISEADAIAEGAEYNYYTTAVDAYRTIWEQINGTDSWEANPWVWVIEFQRAEPAQ